MASAGTERLETFQKYIEHMRVLCLCKICLNPIYEPFVLACGHTYCYSCLASWLGNTHRHGRTKKTCPDCRTEVKTLPSPNYLLRDLAHMFINRVELLPEGEDIEGHRIAREREAAVIATDRTNGTLFKGAFNKRRPYNNWGGHPLEFLNSPIHDRIDNVIRCPRCTWELEDGMCLQCGWGEDSLGDSMSDDGSQDSQGLDSMDDDDSEVDYDFEPTDHAMEPEIMALAQRGLFDAAHQGVAEHIHDSDEDTDYTTQSERQYDQDEEDDMDSFIDDGNMPNLGRHVGVHDSDDSDDDSLTSHQSYDTPPAGRGNSLTTSSQSTADSISNPPELPRPPPVFYGLHDSDGSDDDTTSQSTNYEEVSESHANNVEDNEDDDSSSSEEDDVSIIIPIPPRGRRRPRVVLSDDSEEDSDETLQPSNPVNPVDEDSSSEEDSDDTAIRPPQPPRSRRPPQPPQSRRQRLDFQRARRNTSQNQGRNTAVFQTAGAYHRGNDGRSTNSGIQTARRNWPLRATFVH